MSNIAEVDKKVKLLRVELTRQLGPRAELYFRILKNWFRMRITKPEFFNMTAGLLANERCKTLHNDFLSNLLLKCQLSVVTSLPPVILTIKKKKKKPASAPQSRGDSFGSAFQQFDSSEFITVSPDCVSPSSSVPTAVRTQVDIPFKDEALLPDEATLYGRLYLTATENDLSSVDPDCAKLLLIAVNKLLKNVLTAIFTTRSGFRAKSDKYVHAVGSPAPDPWLRHTALLRKSQLENEFHFEGDNEKEKPNHETAEQRAAYEISCTSTSSQNRNPVTVEDLFRIFQIHKDLIPSHAVYTLFMERISAKLCNPPLEFQ